MLTSDSVAILATLVGFVYLVCALAAAAGGYQLYRQMSVNYSGAHEFGSTPLDESSVPKDSYLQCRAVLRRLDFRHLGTVEDMTLSSAYPELRTLADVHVSADGLTCAATYWTPPQQVLDFETRFADGRFLLTTNGVMTGHLSQPPTIDRRHLPPGIQPSEQLGEHLRVLAEYTSSGGVAEVSGSLSDAIASQVEFTRLQSDYRKRLGYVTLSELRSIARASGVILLPGMLPFLHYSIRWLWRRQDR